MNGLVKKINFEKKVGLTKNGVQRVRCEKDPIFKGSQNAFKWLLLFISTQNAGRFSSIKLVFIITRECSKISQKL